ncbi:MAG: hypothetical protein U0936_02065 [Planctomycetaceae bacterium]
MHTCRSPQLCDGHSGENAEAGGFRVGIESTGLGRATRKTFGKPRLFFAIAAGNMDSMINHYTVNRKVRNDDARIRRGGRIASSGPSDFRLLVNVRP